MATHEARICNRALLRIGQTRLLVNLDESNVWGRSCKALYADSRDATLEARWWPFARRRAPLVALADGERGGWAFAYTLPDDCLAPRFIDDDSGDEAEPIPFETEDDEDVGRVLLCDEEDVELVYTARIEAVVRFSATFVDCLAYKLASDLAFSIAKRPQLGEAMLRAFELTLARAAAASSKQRKPRALRQSIFERRR